MTGASHTRRQALGLIAAASAAAIVAPARAHDGEVHEHIVEITGLLFVPDQLAVKPGDRITWINRDFVPHTATADDKSWTTATLAKDAQETLTVTSGMVDTYYCRFHPNMKARLTITSSDQ
jgi:plastocyanin